MKVKLILRVLTEAKSPFFRPIKYSLFSPLGLATLAGFLAPADIGDLHGQEPGRLPVGAVGLAPCYQQRKLWRCREGKRSAIGVC